MAENPRKRQKLNSPVECYKCSNTYKEPKLLPCFHTFCQSPCLEQLVMSNEQQSYIICPICEEKAILPENGVTGFQSDIQTNRLLEIEAINNVTDKLCGNCEPKNATGYCYDCKQFVCDDCQSYHQKLKITKTHKIITQSNQQSMATDVPFLKKAPLCPKHSSEKLKIYCETCQELICNDCAIRLHHGDCYDVVTAVIEKQKEEIVSSLNPIKEKLDKLHENLKAVNAKARETAEVQACYEEQKLLLEQRRVEVLSKLDSLTQQNLTSLESQRESIEIAQAKLTHCLEYAEGTLTGTDEDILAMKGPLLKRIEELKTKCDPDSIETMSLDDIQPQIKECMEKLQKTYEECLINLEAKNPDVDCSMSESPPLNVSPLLNRFKKPVRVIKNLKHPWKATSNSKGDIIVTERKGNQVSIFNSAGEKICSFGSKGKLNAQFKAPTGVAVDSDDNIYVCENNGNQIQKFTSTGDFIHSVGEKGSGNLQFDSPDGIGYNKTNRKLYVCEEKNNRVQVLNEDLTFHASFGKWGKGNAHFECPSGVSFDQEGQVYIADDSNHRVQVFTAEGDYIRIIATHGSGIGPLANPVDVAVSSNETLFVTHMTDNMPCVSILDTMGGCLGSFGRKGVAEGAFKIGATGVTIGKNETVIITDRNNGRLQIY